MLRRPATLSGTIAVFVLASASMAGAFESGGDAGGNSITVTARNAASLIDEADAVDPAVRLTEYRRFDPCGITQATPTVSLNGECASYAPAVQVPECEGQTPVQPLWRRTRATPTSVWSSWELALDWSCPQDAMPDFTAEDFRRLPIAPPALTIQPNRAQVLVNMATITWTDPTPQLLVTDLLGYTVEVQATPTSYTWDYGDGTDPVTTTSPGHPWPDHDVAHSYARPGTFTITLTTAFTGTYRMAGTTTWLPVTGAATTTTTAPPVTAVEAPTRLVAGDCTTHPDPDDC